MSRTNPILAVPLIVHAGCPGNTVRQGEGALDPAVAMYAVFTFAGIEFLDHLGHSNLIIRFISGSSKRRHGSAGRTDAGNRPPPRPRGPAPRCVVSPSVPTLTLAIPPVCGRRTRSHFWTELLLVDIREDESCTRFGNLLPHALNRGLAGIQHGRVGFARSGANLQETSHVPRLAYGFRCHPRSGI